MGEISRKNAQKVKGFWNTIDKAVEYLIECRNNGQSVYIEFNDQRLYSCDVTLDSAYLQITGLTKEEFEMAKKEINTTVTTKEGEIYIDEEKEKEIINKYEVIKQGHIREAKENAIPAQEQYFGTLDRAVEYLIECRNNGQSVYIEFNDQRLYSCDVTLDSAYLQITGLTKEEFEMAKKEIIGARDEKERDKIIAKWDKIKDSHQEKRIQGKSERSLEEQSIMQKKKQKEQLTSEIGDIEKKLKKLKEKEKKLQELLADKKSKMNQLEEK